MVHDDSRPKRRWLTPFGGDNLAVKAQLARKVLVTRVGQDGTPLRRIKHLSRGTPIEVLRQRSADSQVEVKVIGDPDSQVFLVPADAIDAETARLMSIHRPPRHRRSSGRSKVPLDWKPPTD